MYQLRNVLVSLIVHIMTEAVMSGKILVISPLHLRSHNILMEAIATGSAKRGHQVDVITHFELKNPPKNYQTIVNLGDPSNIVRNLTEIYSKNEKEDAMYSVIESFGNKICELMALEPIQNLIKRVSRGEVYDLIITEAFAANCYIGMGYIFKVPVITVCASITFSWIGDGIGSPTVPSFYADIFMETSVISTFWQRLQNTLLDHINKYKFYTGTDGTQTEFMRKYLNPNIPNIREVERNVALTFVNSYHTLNGIRTTTPGLIEIGGAHIEESDARFSLDLEQWMNNSSSGVIYFSLGTIALVESIPENKLSVLFRSFAKLKPMKVLITVYNEENLVIKPPENVLTYRWVPQIPVLKHKNTKLFITHCGMHGMQESIYYAVPMIAFPITSDQFRNAATLVEKKVAIKLNLETITEEKFDKAIDTILNNETYRLSVKRESQLFRDRPMKIMDLINFWIEYVIRNGEGTLKSPAVDMYWWQIQLLDVYGFIIACAIALIYLTTSIVKFLKRIYFKIHYLKVQHIKKNH